VKDGDEDPIGGGFDLEGGLVRFDLAENVSGLHLIALGFLPLEDQTAFNRLALAGHQNFRCHE
jgi:hypothetical protein